MKLFKNLFEGKWIIRVVYGNVWILYGYGKHHIIKNYQQPLILLELLKYLKLDK